MGSCARASRSERFIAEFNDDYAKCGPTKGTKLEVLSSFLAQEEGNYEQVILVVKCKDQDGNEVTLQAAEFWPFDPEWDQGDDMTERVAEQISINHNEAEERLRKADLLD